MQPSATEYDACLPIDASLETAETIPPDFDRLVEDIRWGSDGALYRMKDCRNSLEALPPHSHMLLRRKGRLIGAGIAIKKPLPVNGKLLNTFYHSLFCVDPGEQGKGYGKLLARYTLERLRGELGRKGLIYAYVEAGNVRSASIFASLGYRRFGHFHAHVVHRLFPRRCGRVHQPTEAEAAMLKRLLYTRYADHALTDFAISFHRGECWALYEGDAVVASVQVLPQSWQIEGLACLEGSPMLRAVLGLPILRNLIYQRTWKFLKVGNIYFADGRADAFFSLLDDLLRRFQAKIAVLFLDHRSPVSHQLRSSQTFGVLDTVAQARVNVWGMFHQLSDAEVSYLLGHPLAISPVDI